jgi:hypothetical protein
VIRCYGLYRCGFGRFSECGVNATVCILNNAVLFLIFKCGIGFLKCRMIDGTNLWIVLSDVKVSFFRNAEYGDFRNAE